MTADPPWLGEAAIAGMSAYNHADAGDRELAYVRAILAFAARQPREITEAMVEAAFRSLVVRRLGVTAVDARAALEAAEKASVA